MPRNKVNNRKKKPAGYYQPNAWRALSDVFIASMNKGQFPIAIVGIIFLAIIIKMPPDDVSILAKDILQSLKNFRLMGWLLSVILAFLWFFSNKRLRKTSSKEVSRIGDQKTDLQEKLVLRKLDSSNLK